MKNSPLTLSSFPRAILHIDGDAFFASCEQSRNPAWQGKPVITGKERGIAASLSYEAKALGVTRGMRLSEIKKNCPQAIILPSDYETYSLLSTRFFNIIRRYTPQVEEYSIDECFADLTGLRRPYHKSYQKIAQDIKMNLEQELGFTFSFGLATNKVMAKVGSKWNKPAGLTIIPGNKISHYLGKLPLEKIWGIGPQTTAFLEKFGLKTALDLAKKNEGWIKHYLSKPFFEIWQELNGRFIYPINNEKKSSYASIQKVKTFTPPSNNRDFVLSQLSKNIENACLKARRYQLAAGGAAFFLRSQNFKDKGLELKFSRATNFPHEIIKFVTQMFNQIYKNNDLYRATGFVLLKLIPSEQKQLNLFEDPLKIDKMNSLYQAVDQIRLKYGKHTIYLGASFLANKFHQHLGMRGDEPLRKKILFKGETKRRRLAIPMFLGSVN